jgi:uncharacterized YccA/Bax inhibitor family protein
MSNPIFKKLESDSEYVNTAAYPQNSVMTVDGTLQITGVMGLVMAAAAYYTWSRFSLGYMDIATMLTGLGAIIGFVLALIISFAKIKYLVPFYAVCEGFFLGGISASFEASYPGIVSQAIAGTFAALFAMIILYRFKLITCTEKFRSTVITATITIAGVYLIDIIGRLIFHHSVPIINSASPAGLLVSVIIVIVAALNLILDFDFIEKGSQMMLPKDYEWFGAFGLMVTIVWLYVEILRLLAKLQRR